MSSQSEKFFLNLTDQSHVSVMFWHCELTRAWEAFILFWSIQKNTQQEQAWNGEMYSTNAQL